MILVIDSGASKLEWRFVGGGEIIQGKTNGFHALIDDHSLLEQILRDIRTQIPNDPSSIYFYGAGSLQQSVQSKLKKVVISVFHQSQIEISSDLLAVARSLCGHEPGIACILGTGSNSCYYDGMNIKFKVPSLGYLLGDEGSGTALGKALLIAYCRKELPDDLSQTFIKRYDLTSDQVIESTLQSDKPNRLISQYAKFLFHHIHDPFIDQLIEDTFIEFVDKVLMKYGDLVNQHPISFSGSIAFYFNSILRRVLQSRNLQMGRVVESPIAGLTLFHQSQIDS